jgi:hypothetical protein
MKYVAFLLPAVVFAAGATLGSAQTPEVIYTKIASSPTADIPGTLDLAGMPAPTQWRALEDFSVSGDGSYWMVKGRTQLGSDLETILVRGSGTAGTMFAQEGQPVAGSVVMGELYDFFDSGDPVSFDSSNNIGFSFRARGGVANTLEKIVYYDNTLATHTILAQQGVLYVGSVDNPPGNSGDEQIGNSVDSVSLLDSGPTIAFVNTPIQNCSSTRYPGFGRSTAVSTTMWKQSGVTAVTTFNGADTWDTFGLSDCGTTPDGMHWYIEGESELEPTTSDKIFVIDDVITMQEGFPVVSGGPVLADIFQTRMVSNGDWISRGDDPFDDDWVVFNGNLVLKTGDAVEGGQVGVSISGVACNRVGDWVATCGTTNPDPAVDEVLLYNGVVVLREGDPVDVDGNGMFDDDVFIGRANNALAAFAANDLYLTDDRTLYAIVELRDSMGNDWNTTTPTFGTPDAFVRMSLPITHFCDSHDNALASCPCLNPGNPDSGCDIAQGTGGVRLDIVAQQKSPQNRATVTGTGYPTNATPGAVVIRSGTLDTGSPVVFGDGVRCISVPLVRLGASSAAGGMSTHTFGHGTAAGPGTFYYQIWFRNQPPSFCDPLEAFNLSNGRTLTW